MRKQHWILSRKPKRTKGRPLAPSSGGGTSNLKFQISNFYRCVHSVTIGLMNGGLNIQGPSELGTSLLMLAAPAAPTAGYGVPFLLKNTRLRRKRPLLHPANADVLASHPGRVLRRSAGRHKAVHRGHGASHYAMTTLAGAANTEKGLNLGGGNIRLVAFGQTACRRLYTYDDDWL
jgi:hypothetical protein